MEKASMIFMIIILGIVWGGFIVCVLLDLLSGGEKESAAASAFRKRVR